MVDTLHPTYIYAIYPLDKNGDYAGVYVGAAKDIKIRFSRHLCTYKGTEEIQRLHNLMRENGFFYQILCKAKNIDQTYLEYDWIEYFETQTQLHVFNTKKGLHADAKRVRLKNTRVCLWE